MSTAAVLVLALLLVPASAAPQSRPDFSGTWILDVERSSSSDGARLRPETLTVRQTESVLSIERSGEPGVRVVALDGTETVIESPTPAKIHARWIGDRLRVTMDFGVGGSFLHWSISPDRKTLTVDGIAIQHTQERGGKMVTEELRVKRIYVRKEEDERG